MATHLLLFLELLIVLSPIHSFSSSPSDSPKRMDAPKAAAKTAAKTKNFSRTFFRRVLPDSCTAFSSPQGRAIFASAMAGGGLLSFFSLIEQHVTQSEPAYCGMSTLVVALNAFQVDPKQAWKGPWRWYTEQMLNCCLDLEQVKETGITLPDFACLAVCQGLSVDLRYAATTQGSLSEFRAAVEKACIGPADATSNDGNNHSLHEPPTKRTKIEQTEARVRDILIVSYNRKILGQTGTGHFSPIAAYDPTSDSVLILDTARFKYGAHWVPLPLLHSAMLPQDDATGKSRGFVLLSVGEEAENNASAIPGPLAHMPVSILFRYKFHDQARRLQAEYFCDFFQQSKPSQSLEWETVLNYWTQNGKDPAHIWQIMEPQLKPDDTATHDLVNQMVDRIREIMPKKSETKSDGSSNHSSCHNRQPCRPNRSRTLSLCPEEAIYLVYLASLPNEINQKALIAAQPDAPTMAEEQLLASVHLLRTVLQLAGDKDTTENNPTKTIKH